MHVVELVFCSSRPGPRTRIRVVLGTRFRILVVLRTCDWHDRIRMVTYGLIKRMVTYGGRFKRMDPTLP